MKIQFYKKNNLLQKFYKRLTYENQGWLSSLNIQMIIFNNMTHNADLDIKCYVVHLMSHLKSY